VAEAISSTFVVTVGEVSGGEVVNEVEATAKELSSPVTATVDTMVVTPITLDYTYDPLYRLTSASYSSGETYSYSYDGVGNRLTMVSPGGTVNYTYDAANRLTDVGGVAYTWDANGNLTSDGVRSYTYDQTNRLTQVTEGSLTTQFAYNGDGVRTSKTVGGDTTEYVLDLLATLPVVISDTEAVYLYGLDIIAQQQSARYYYMHDGLGSVRQLVDTTGQIETNYAYDPFGVPQVGGEVHNPYQFTGEAWDAEVELLYLRARYYQPEVGRFITKDPWAGDPWAPATLNLYVYARNNPVNVVDPSGFQSCGWHHCQPQVVDPDPELRRIASDLLQVFGIVVGEERWSPMGWEHGEPQSYYVLWSNWSEQQLNLVGEAASDFASKMQGGPADLRSKVGRVPLYKREGELVIPFLGPKGGWTFFTGVTLPGNYWDFEGGAWMKSTIVHELAHVWDSSREGGRLSYELASGFWTSQLAQCEVPREERGSAVPVVRDWRLGRTMEWLNPREDWADSVVAYVYPDYVGSSDRKKEISEGRWDYVATYMNPGNPKRFAYPEKWRGIRFLDTRLVGKYGQVVSSR